MTPFLTPIVLESLSKKISNARWIVSYDDTIEVNKMYSTQIKRVKYSLLHTARNVRIGEEILFFSKGLMMPQISYELI